MFSEISWHILTLCVWMQPFLPETQENARGNMIDMLAGQWWKNGDLWFPSCISLLQNLPHRCLDMLDSWESRLNVGSGSTTTLDNPDASHCPRIERVKLMQNCKVKKADQQEMLVFKAPSAASCCIWTFCSCHLLQTLLRTTFGFSMIWRWGRKFIRKSILWKTCWNDKHSGIHQINPRTWMRKYLAQANWAGLLARPCRISDFRFLPPYNGKEKPLY